MELVLLRVEDEVEAVLDAVVFFTGVDLRLELLAPLVVGVWL